MPVTLRTSALTRRGFYKKHVNNFLLRIENIFSLVYGINEITIVTSELNQSNPVTYYECDFSQPIINGLLIQTRFRLIIKNPLKFMQKTNKSNYESITH